MFPHNLSCSSEGALSSVGNGWKRAARYLQVSLCVQLVHVKGSQRPYWRPLYEGLREEGAAEDACHMAGRQGRGYGPITQSAADPSNSSLL